MELILFFVILQSLQTTDSMLTVDSLVDQTQSLPCIWSIMLKYFTPGQSVVVSMDNQAHHEDVLYLLNEALLWPLVLSVPGSPVLDVSHEDPTKHGGYFLFLQDEADDLLDNLITQMEDVQLNPRGRFLLAVRGSNERSTAQSLAEELWLSYNVMDILIQIDEELYTWIPYKSPDTCGQIDTFLIAHCEELDNCDRNRYCIPNGKFEPCSSCGPASDLYPAKIPMNFLGCPLRITAIDTPPHLVLKGENNTYAGLEVAYVEYIMAALNITIQYQEMPEGNAVEARTTALTSVSSGMTDIIFGGFPLHPLGISFADYTVSYLGDVLKWYVPCGIPYSRMEKVATIFSVTVWLTVALVFFMAVITMRIAAKNDAAIYRQITGCVYVVWALILGVSAPEMPWTLILRSVFISMVWYCFAISMVFQTYFTSILVDPGVTDQISSSEELYRSGLLYHFDDDLDDFINVSIPEYHSQIPLHRVPCRHKNKCLLDYFTSQSITTICFNLHTEFFIRAGLPMGSSIPQVCNLQEDIYTLQFTMYLAKGSPLVNPINFAIRRVTEAGLLDKLSRDRKAEWRYLNWSDEVMTLDSIYNVNDDIVGYFVFSLGHLQLAFYILLMGLGASFVLVLLEMLLLYK